MDPLQCKKKIQNIYEIGYLRGIYTYPLDFQKEKKKKEEMLTISRIRLVAGKVENFKI